MVGKKTLKEIQYFYCLKTLTLILEQQLLFQNLDLVLYLKETCKNDFFDKLSKFFYKFRRSYTIYDIAIYVYMWRIHGKSGSERVRKSGGLLLLLLVCL